MQIINKIREDKEILSKIILSDKKISEDFKNFAYDIVEELEKRKFNINNIYITNFFIKITKDRFLISTELMEIKKALYFSNYDFVKYDFLIIKVSDNIINDFVELFKKN